MSEENYCPCNIINAKRNLLTICCGFDEEKSHPEQHCLKQQIFPRADINSKLNNLVRSSK